MQKVQISKKVAQEIERLRNLPHYKEQKDTEGAIIEAHADKNGSWGKGNALHDENISVGLLARALLIGYEVVEWL